MNQATNLKLLAKKYDSKRKIDRKTLKEIVCSVLTNLNIKSGQQILDIGCGTGRILIPLASETSGASFTGIDVSNEMLRTLFHNISSKKINNVKILSHDANQRLPFRDGQFDSVILYHSYHIINNKKLLASEVARVIKKGGNLLVASTSHSQLATMLNYKYIPEMLKLEYQRTPDLNNIAYAFRKNNFRLTRMNEVLIKKSFNSIRDLVDFLKERPISALTFFPDQKLDELVSKMYREFTYQFGEFAIDYGFDYHTQMFFKKNDSN